MSSRTQTVYECDICRRKFFESSEVQTFTLPSQDASTCGKRPIDLCGECAKELQFAVDNYLRKFPMARLPDTVYISDLVHTLIKLMKDIGDTPICLSASGDPTTDRTPFMISYVKAEPIGMLTLICPEKKESISPEGEKKEAPKGESK